MSSQLLTLHPAPIPNNTNPNSKKNPTLTTTTTSTTPLYQRIFIPSHVYRHPSAILLELCTSLKELHQILPLVIKNGFYKEHLFQTKLISLFCKFNSITVAARVFEPVEHKLDVLYHTMLKGYAKNSTLRDALRFYDRMRCDEVMPVVYDFTYLLQLCGENLDLRRGRDIHGIVITNWFQSNLFAMTAVVNLYAKCRQIQDAYTKVISLFWKFGSISEAARVFEPVEHKLDVLYHTMLKGYAKNSSLGDALSFFYRMMCDEVRPVVGDYACLLRLCGENLDLKRGREIHGLIITNGFGSNLFAMTAIMNLYAKCRQIDDAYKVFERMPQKDLVSWTTLVAGYAQNGYAKRALQLVLKMQEAGQKPDSVTLVSILPAIADLKALRNGRSIHGYAFRSGFESLVNVANALLDMYFKCGSARNARLFFEGMSSKSVVSWNTMIDGCAQNGESDEAFATFLKMLDEGEVPTRVTIMGALLACANLGDLERGRFVHKLLDKLKLDSNVSVMNSLISMYSICKRVDTAASIFDNLMEKKNVTWNAMILGYAQNGCVKEALNLFSMMQSQGIKLYCFTLVGVITALADYSVNHQAKWIHGLAIRTYMDKNVFVSTALVDMYAKCGANKTARKLFDMMQERHVIKWNAMIDGYGTHSLGKEALDLFNEMQKGAVKPNDITFLSVISACSHSGFVEEGLFLFKSMKEDYDLEPTMDHYSAMVDLLGRAGQLDDAWNFMQEMRIKPGISVLGAMLGACEIHKNVELGEKAADKLFELDPDEGGYHVLLANIYASNSMWHKVAKVRTAMEKKGAPQNSTKQPCSDVLTAHQQKFAQKTENVCETVPR